MRYMIELRVILNILRVDMEGCGACLRLWWQSIFDRIGSMSSRCAEWKWLASAIACTRLKLSFFVEVYTAAQQPPFYVPLAMYASAVVKVERLSTHITAYRMCFKYGYCCTTAVYVLCCNVI